jgi:membrane associated rhomboid family serine protease
MAIGTRSYARPYLPNEGRLPSAVKWLLIVNVGVYIVQFFLASSTAGLFLRNLMLVPNEVVHDLAVWQVVTYMFLHGNVYHLLFNMLALFQFGCDLEMAWGTRRFLQFYFFCGVGAGLMVVIANYLFGNPNIATLGSSGAIYGILLVAAVLWPDRIILMMFLFPIKLKYAVMIFGGIAFMGTFNQASAVSDVAHLSGMAFGYLFLKLPKVRKFDAFSTASQGYKAWKMARAKKKFQVYLRKKQSDRGDFVN